MSEPILKPWPTAADVANRLRVPLASLTEAERDAVDEQLAAAVDFARVVPDWRDADQIPPRVWSAVVGHAALSFRIANAAHGVDTANGDQGNASSALWRFRLDMGHGRGGRPRAR